MRKNPKQRLIRLVFFSKKLLIEIILKIKSITDNAHNNTVYIHIGQKISIYSQIITLSNFKQIVEIKIKNKIASVVFESS